MCGTPQKDQSLGTVSFGGSDPAGRMPEAMPSHMFRDTFAVELLLAEVPIEQVAMLLGHSSVKMAEKHYLPWVKARQDQLTSSVRRAWLPEILGDEAETVS